MRSSRLSIGARTRNVSSWLGRHGFLRQLPFCALLLALSATGRTQEAALPPPAASSSAPEITSQEEMPTFKVKVNLVEVRVVVRDAKGQVIDNLKQSDFLLFDNGKPQVISKFSVERATDNPTIHSEPAIASANEPPPIVPVPPALAKNFIAYLFDDKHLSVLELDQARNAALKHLQSLRPDDRAGLFTTSGIGQQDFTDDRAKLISAINRIVPTSHKAQQFNCPYVTYYQANLIVNVHDPYMLQITMDDAAACTLVDSEQKLAQLVNDAARRELQVGDDEVRLALSMIDGLAHRMAELPGSRTIVLVSPGFFLNNNGDLRWRETETMQRAVNAKVVINTLDARGLYTPGPDVSVTRQPSSSTAGRMLQYQTEEQNANQDVLAELASATGGTFFRNNNNLEEGFHRLAAQPEVSYLLGFAPQNVKLDGAYHALKVKLQPPAEGNVQARKGYFAPKATTDASEQAKAAIEDAVFSQEEVRDIPVELHTQFFKPDDNNAKLSVLVRVDVRNIHFSKANGRNNTDVRVVSALFDHNGNFIAGNQKLVQLHLKDETLENRVGSGITLKSSFDVKPGSYVVRLVVRDASGQLAAQNLAVQIP